MYCLHQDDAEFSKEHFCNKTTCPHTSFQEFTSLKTAYMHISKIKSKPCWIRT